MESLGLTSAEAEARLVEHGVNALPSEKEKNLLQVAFSVLREPMLLLLAAAGAISFLLAELVDALLLMATVFIVLGISIYQERRTERALSALRELTAPLALVIRDGKEQRIGSSQIVPGDLLVLLEGDRIAADSILVSRSPIEVDESLLTGESIPVAKEEGMPIFTGSLVVRGHGRGKVTRTGVDTELGKIGKSMQEIPYQRTLLQRNVDRLVKGIGTLSLIAVIAIFYLYGSSRGNWLEGALAGIAAAMALIPEEFPVIITLFMALGAWRMAKVKVIARQPAVIEALGAVTVLCVDKTGTITRNEMEVTEIHCSSEVHNFDGSPLSESLLEAVEIASLALPSRPFDPMDKAFVKLAEILKKRKSLRSIQEFPLTHKRLAFIHLWQGDSGVIAAAKGAPEEIFKMCQLSINEVEYFENQVHVAAARGFRVLGIARADVSEVSEFNVETTPFKFLGIALLHDPVREGVPEAIKVCAGAGVKTIMITGDHPSTALAIGKEIGIDGIDSCITGAELNSMSDEELHKCIQKFTIFARVSPEHKLRIVRALKSLGEVVAMTGDGVNDAPALRASDVGIAMGGRGTDVAREAASLVITDDNYTSIVAGIHRGRAIFANIKKAMSYVIAIHVPIFLMALVPVLRENWPLILLPALIAFHEVIIDPACSVVFEVEEPDPEIMRRPPRAARKVIFGSSEIFYAALQGLTVFVGVFTVFNFSISEGYNEEEIRSLTFATLLIANLFLILANRSRTLTILESLIKRKNIAVPWIFASAIALLLLLLNVPFLSSSFELTAIDWRAYFSIALVAYLSIAWTDAHKLINRIRAGH